MARTPRRCEWALANPLETAYHDREWGVPVRDDRRLFEFLLLEGAQAGLSWDTILAKRENYRRAFDDFDPERIARYDDARIAALLADPGIVRNRLKVRSAVANARAALELRGRGIALSVFLWRFVDGVPVQNRFRRSSDVPSSTAASEAMSKALRAEGFRFVGSTICYAFMQATGMVNDHLVDCFRHGAVREVSAQAADGTSTRTACQ